MPKRPHYKYMHRGDIWIGVPIWVLFAFSLFLRSLNPNGKSSQHPALAFLWNQGPRLSLLLIIFCSALVIYVITFMRPRQKRKAKDNNYMTCPSCGYDCSANPDFTACPECGLVGDANRFREIWTNPKAR